MARGAHRWESRGSAAYSANHRPYMNDPLRVPLRLRRRLLRCVGPKRARYAGTAGVRVTKNSADTNVSPDGEPGGHEGSSGRSHRSRRRGREMVSRAQRNKLTGAIRARGRTTSRNTSQSVRRKIWSWGARAVAIRAKSQHQDDHDEAGQSGDQRRPVPVAARRFALESADHRLPEEREDERTRRADCELGGGPGERHASLHRLSAFHGDGERQDDGRCCGLPATCELTWA
jgi:hypothetical protein